MAATMASTPRPPPSSPLLAPPASSSSASTAPVAARARKSLSAARAARDGITSTLSSIRAGRPPAPPLARRRAALMPPSSRAESERSDKGGDGGDEATIKRQWAKALLRKRAAERQRDAALRAVEGGKGALGRAREILEGEGMDGMAEALDGIERALGGRPPMEPRRKTWSATSGDDCGASCASSVDDAAIAALGGEAVERLRRENEELRAAMVRIDAERGRACEELESAKKTIGRVVQERNAARRGAGSTPGKSSRRGEKHAFAGLSGTDSETIRKVLEWQRTHSLDGSEREVEGESSREGEAVANKRARACSPSLVAAEEAVVLVESGWKDRPEVALGARATSGAVFNGGGASAPAGVAETLASGAGEAAIKRGASAERSHTPDPEAVISALTGHRVEVGSVHSLGVGDNFRESAANSVAGDEIHVVPSMNIFQSQAGPSKAAGGLLGLLG